MIPKKGRQGEIEIQKCGKEGNTCAFPLNHAVFLSKAALFQHTLPSLKVDKQGKPKFGNPYRFGSMLRGVCSNLICRDPFRWGHLGGEEDKISSNPF